MMKCSQYERLVALLCDGELEGPLRREVRSHVASCVVCTRQLASLDRVQELLLQEIDSQVEKIDFSSFWEQVESRLRTPKPSWSVRLQLWCERWWPDWSLRVPVSGVAVALVLVSLWLFSHIRSSVESLTVPHPPTPFTLAANNQAQIESLSAATTVALWNEPTSNSPVIWIEDDRDGAVP
jgi:anti-sigma factor RsiW